MTRPRLTMLKPRIGMAPTTRVPLLLGTPGATPREKGRPWRRLRAQILSANPLCCHCQREGRVGAATVVDHREPHRGDQRLFWDETNWQPMCKAHHDSDKRREEAG